MVAKCCTVECTSGYKNKTKKVSQFSHQKILVYSKDSKNYKEKLCCKRQDLRLFKHFSEEDIVRYWESGGIKVRYYFD